MGLSEKYFFSKKIFDGYTLQENNSRVLVFEGERLKDVIPLDLVMPQEIQIVPGMLMPGLVNAHHHTELSFLHGQITRGCGFVNFATAVVQKRKLFSEDEKKEAAFREIHSLWENGTSLCGDISNTLLTAEIKHRSAVGFHTFVECIAYTKSDVLAAYRKAIRMRDEFQSRKNTSSLSAHAPYTVLPRLFRNILRENQMENKVTTIHYMESKPEKLWYEGKCEGVQNLFSNLNIPFPPPENFIDFYHPVRFLNYVGSANVLLVHATMMDVGGISDIPASIKICFCPRSNVFIENKTPSSGLIKKFSDVFCLGTDSLASNTDGSVLEEACFLWEKYPFLTAEQVLRAITLNGAIALGREKEFGSLEAGKTPGLIEMEIKNKKFIFKKRYI